RLSNRDQTEPSVRPADDDLGAVRGNGDCRDRRRVVHFPGWPRPALDIPALQFSRPLFPGNTCRDQPAAVWGEGQGPYRVQVGAETLKCEIGARCRRGEQNGRWATFIMVNAAEGQRISRRSVGDRPSDASFGKVVNLADGAERTAFPNLQ